MKVRKTIKGASQSLSLLSKVRCVESYSFSSESKPKGLYSWPSQFEGDNEVRSLLSSKGINLNANYRVKSLPIEYALYKNLNKIEIPEIVSIRLARSLLHVYQLVVEKVPITKITAVWDSEQYPNRSYPSSMSDFQALKEFSSYRDSMLLIEREGEPYSIKLPAFSYRSLLEAVPEIENHKIFPKDRSDFIGEKADKTGRSRRYVVHKGNKGHLLKVLKQTSASINKLIGGDNWVTILKHDGKNYYESK